ncbi:MAG: tandem-95 repeat protein, partial [Cyanobacteria bacterium J06607_13]
SLTSSTVTWIGADYAGTFTEGGTPISVMDVDVAITDIDDTNLESARVTFANPQTDDVLSIGSVAVFENGAIANPTITSGNITYTVSLGLSGEVIVSLAGSDTVANYESALKEVAFSNTSENPDTTDRTFTVSVNDGDADSNIANSTLTVAEVNDPPVAVLDEVTTPEDTAVTFNPLTDAPGTDSDVDGNLDPTSVVFVNEPTGSTLSPDGKTLDVPGEGEYSIDPTTGEVTFTPEPDFNGMPTPVTYQVADDDGATATAPIQVTVDDVNDPPVAVLDKVTTPEDTAVTFDPLTNDSDIDGTLEPTSVVFVNEPTGSTLSPDGKTLDVPGEGEYSIDPTTGEVTFTPEPDFDGTPTPIDYQVSDDDGGTATGTIEATITPTNDAPVLDLDGDDSTAPGADYANTFTEGGAPISVVDADVAISDIDDTQLESATVTFDNPQADDVLSIGSVAVFENGAIATPTITSGGITYSVSLGTTGEVIVSLAGSETLANYETALKDITFANTSEAPDTTDRTFTISVNDGDADSNIANSTLTVAEVNDPPVAVLDEVTTPEDTAVTFDPLANDSDVDGTLDPTSVVFVNEPTGSTLSPDGKTLEVPSEGEYSIDPTTGEVTFTP